MSEMTGRRPIKPGRRGKKLPATESSTLRQTRATRDRAFELICKLVAGQVANRNCVHAGLYQRSSRPFVQFNVCFGS